jgi:hypothetical protein
MPRSELISVLSMKPPPPSGVGFDAGMKGA